MDTKIVHAFDPLTHAYLGPVVLDGSDRSPLDPGEWHIPANCLETEPPTADAGFHIEFREGVWVLIADQKLESEPDIPEAPPSQPTEPELTLHDMLQKLMDAAARAKGYDSLATAISYADEVSVPQFGAEGRAFRTWRSRVWAHIYARADGADELSFDDLVKELPVLDFAAEQAWTDALTAKPSKAKKKV